MKNKINLLFISENNEVTPSNLILSTLINGISKDKFNLYLNFIDNSFKLNNTLFRGCNILNQAQLNDISFDISLIFTFQNGSFFPLYLRKMLNSKIVLCRISRKIDNNEFWKIKDYYDGFIFNSIYLYNLFKDKKSSNNIVLYNTINSLSSKELNKISEKTIEFKKKNNISGLIIGSYSNKYNYSWSKIIKESYPLLVWKFPDIKFLFIDPSKEMHEISENSAISDKVIFLDKTDNIDEILLRYNLIDIFLHNPINENDNDIHLLYSILMNKAFITSVYPNKNIGQWELFHHRIGGLYANSSTPFFNAISLLHDNPDLRKKLSNEGKMLLENKFSKNIIIKQYENYFESLFKGEKINFNQSYEYKKIKNNILLKGYSNIFNQQYIESKSLDLIESKEILKRALKEEDSNMAIASKFYLLGHHSFPYMTSFIIHLADISSKMFPQKKNVWEDILNKSFSKNKVKYLLTLKKFKIQWEEYIKNIDNKILDQ